MTTRAWPTKTQQRLDLAEAWRRDRALGNRAGASDAPGCRGHGWMLDAGIVGVIAPLLYHFRAEDIGYYSWLGAVEARRLLRLLPEEYLAEQRQNDAPTIGNVLRAVAARPGDLVAHGYVIGAGRCDESPPSKASSSALTGSTGSAPSTRAGPCPTASVKRSTRS